MILLTVLLTILIGAILVLTIGLTIFGAASILVFGDLIIFLIIIGLIIRHFVKK